MDLAFKYGLKDIYNFFLRLLVLELFRPMLGKLEIQLARIYRSGIRTTLAVIKPLWSHFCGKRNQNHFKYSYNSYWQASFGILLIYHKRFYINFCQERWFCKSKNSILFINICYNLYIKSLQLEFPAFLTLHWPE